jgi:uncharacterized membrane protein YgaE (UPF0421/DUF939 family)
MSEAAPDRRAISGTTFSALSNAQLAIRAAIAATVAAVIAQTLGLDYPIYAFLAAIIATDLTQHQSRQLGLRRLAATLLGAAGGGLVSSVLPPSAWSAGLAIFGTVLVARRLNVRNGAKVAGYVSAIIVLHFSPDPWGHAYDRLIETALGITVAWLASFVPLLFRNQEVEARLSEQQSQAARWLQLDLEPTDDDPLTLLADAQIAIRTAVAATLAALISQLLGLAYPIFAAISAIITTDLAPAASITVGARRIVATIIGAACGSVGSLVVGTEPWWLGVALLVTMLGCQSLRSPEGSKVAACTCGIGMLMHGGHPVSFAVHRVVETGLGVATAWVVSYLPKLFSHRPRTDSA